MKKFLGGVLFFIMAVCGLPSYVSGYVSEFFYLAFERGRDKMKTHITSLIAWGQGKLGD